MPEQPIDQNHLLDTAFVEGRAAFEAVIARYPTERFYAFCFYADNDVTSVFPTANTTEGIDRIFDEKQEERIYFQWNPAEWKLDFGSNDFMAKTKKLLYPTSFSPEPPSVFGKRKLDVVFQPKWHTA
jgi:Domain of unknown function (DUF4303)